MPIALNSKKRSLVIRATSNTTVSCANAQVGSEVVVGMGITHILWSGDWTIKRGANTLLVLNADSGGAWDLTTVGSLKEDAAGDIVLTQGTVLGSIVLAVTKYNDDQTET